jgi:hypothetical protein
MFDCRGKCCEKCFGEFIDTYKINKLSRDGLKADYHRYSVCPNCSTYTDDPYCHSLENLRLDDLK